MYSLILLSALVGQSPEDIRSRAGVREGDDTATRPILADQKNTWPTIKVPGQVTGEAGRPIVIAGESNGKAIYWFCQDDTRALTRLTEKSTLFTTPKPGRYRVWSWSVLGDRSTNANLTWVVVTPATDDPDTPPEPIPPKPPVPPVPPVPPQPTDPLAKEIADAYTADVGTSKAATLGKLIDFYKAVAVHVADKNTKTVGVFLEVYSETAAKFLPPDELMGVRQIIGKRVAALFSADSESAIDDTTRTKAVSFFNQIVAALQAVKK